MGFEITDEMVLRLSGAADAVYAFHSLAAPRNLHETHMDKAHPGTAGTDASWRWMGLNLGAQSAADLTIAASDSPKVKKDYLKVAGMGWACAAGMTAYNAQEGIQKRDMGLTGAAVQAGMAALCLWRGFKKEEEGK